MHHVFRAPRWLLPMTIFGKILAIFVFLLSLVWFFLTVNLYATRAEWKKAYETASKAATTNARDTEELKKQIETELGDRKSVQLEMFTSPEQAQWDRDADGTPRVRIDPDDHLGILRLPMGVRGGASWHASGGTADRIEMHRRLRRRQGAQRGLGCDFGSWNQECVWGGRGVDVKRTHAHRVSRHWQRQVRAPCALGRFASRDR